MREASPSGAHFMDERVKRAVEIKIGESTASANDLSDIKAVFEGVVNDGQDFVLGVLIGRVYNSFHYQTRRILHRNATREEFDEFLQILTEHIPDIKKAIKQQ